MKITTWFVADYDPKAEVWNHASFAGKQEANDVAAEYLEAGYKVIGPVKVQLEGTVLRPGRVPNA